VKDKGKTFPFFINLSFVCSSYNTERIPHLWERPERINEAADFVKV